MHLVVDYKSELLPAQTVTIIVHYQHKKKTSAHTGNAFDIFVSIIICSLNYALSNASNFVA